MASLARHETNVRNAGGTGTPACVPLFPARNRCQFGDRWLKIHTKATITDKRKKVYETISPVEANFNPDWLDESAWLVREPEVAGWYIPMPDTLRARALEVAAGAGATLVVPGRAPEQQALQLVAEAAQAHRRMEQREQFGKIVLAV